MTPSELKKARHKLGLSANAFARLVGVSDGRTVRRWEDGTQDVPGPVMVLLGTIMAVPAARKHLGVEIVQCGCNH